MSASISRRQFKSGAVGVLKTEHDANAVHPPIELHAPSITYKHYARCVSAPPTLSGSGHLSDTDVAKEG